MVNKKTNRNAIVRYSNTRFFEKKNELLNEVGVFKAPSSKANNTISNMTCPIISEPIRPDEVQTYKKHKLVSRLGCHTNTMKNCRFIKLNNGSYIEPERSGFKSVFTHIEYEQFKLLCKLYAEQFVNRHGYISQVGLLKMLHENNRFILSDDIVRDTVLTIQANEPTMKHSGKNAEHVVNTWSNSSNYTRAQKTRLENIIKCCYR